MSDQARLFVRGDTHGDQNVFLELDKTIGAGDYLFICGDFGFLFKNDIFENRFLDDLQERPYTILFVDGNHENFDRLYNEFEIVDFHGGKAHKIRDNIYHLMRGYVFNFEGKKFFAFGGASCHDIKDGILDRDDYQTDKEFKKIIKIYQWWRRMFRINHISWWKEELPSQEEMDFGLKTLSERGYKVDYVITHCLPQEVCSMLGFREPDTITLFFNTLLRNGLKFTKWYCGHYHLNTQIMGKFNILYESIVRIV
jgi:predicted phosphodiesterase